MESQTDQEERSSSTGEGDDARHPAIQKLHERKERHQGRSRPARYGVVALGALVTLVGVVMTGPVPGPGFLVIPIGLALLALQFDWAEGLYEKAVVWADNAKEKAANQTKTEKIISGVVAAIAVGAFVVAAILWDIPFLPV